jgi:RNA polymerase sigma factor (sigma-70 family)
MSEQSISTVVNMYLNQLRDGNLAARDQLIRVATSRLEKLTHKMLRHQFGRVGRWADTNDVLQSATLRLWKSLEKSTPESALHFHRLAARLIRHELVDLARHYYGPMGTGANHESIASVGLENVNPQGPSNGTPASEWSELHTLVQSLPPDEAEITDLLFYQGLLQEEAADLLGVDVRTVQRRWQRARRKLGSLLTLDN